MVGYDPARNPLLSSLDYTLAGAMSGLITRALFQPFDVVKIRFQLQVEPISTKSSYSKYKSINQCVRCIIREEGVRALWKGHVPAQYLSIIFGGAEFWSYELATQAAHSSQLFADSDRFWVNFGCGAFAGGVASCISFPFDVIRTHLVAQGQTKVIHNFRSSFIYIYQQNGLKSFYRGLTPLLIQILPYAGFQFSFNRLTNHLWTLSPISAPDPVRSFICGGLAGTIAKCLVYPLDLVKKRLQIQGFGLARQSFGATLSYKGFIDCIIVIVRTESVLGLFKGLTPSLMKAFITSASQFLFYDQSLKAILLFKS